jgi:hypothetical protein
MLKAMKPTNFSRAGIALLALFAALPAMADTQFRPARMTRNDVPLGKGQCDIRLQVDDQVEVSVRRDLVSIRTLSGREARDDGSECNEPLPDRDIQGFNFEVKDSRNEIRLLDEPNRRNGFTAFVRIRDNDGGYGRYHFRLTWAITGSGGFSNDRPGGSSNDRPGDFRRDGGPPDFGRRDDDRGRFAWNNVIHFSGSGRGSSNLTGIGSQRLFDANVDIDRGGRIQVSFRTDSGRPITFAGNVIGRDGDALKADVAGDDRMLRLRGPMYISVDQRQNVYRISLDATNGRDNLRLNWDRR